MTEQERHLAYLGACNAWGWAHSEEGLRAFMGQQDAGWRDKTGRMIWPN